MIDNFNPSQEALFDQPTNLPPTMVGRSIGGPNMARLIRKCSQCGTTDARRTWSSIDEASKQGAFDEKWTCASCAWSEFELADAEEEPARA